MTITVKVISRTIQAEAITSFMAAVINESSSQCNDYTTIECRRGVAVTFEASDAEAAVDCILDCYETMGMEIPGGVEIDVFEVAVIISDAELQTYFDQMRLNFNCVQTEVLGEVSFAANSVAERLDQKVDRIDTLCELNGTYKMREVITTMASEMETKGIVVADAINRIVGSTVH